MPSILLRLECGGRFEVNELCRSLDHTVSEGLLPLDGGRSDQSESANGSSRDLRHPCPPINAFGRRRLIRRMPRFRSSIDIPVPWSTSTQFSCSPIRTGTTMTVHQRAPPSCLPPPSQASVSSSRVSGVGQCHSHLRSARGINLFCRSHQTTR